MKIILCLNRDVHSAIALNLLHETLKNHQIQLFFSNKVGNKSNLPESLLQLIHYEQIALNDLFKKLDETNQNKKFLTFKQIAKSLNCEIKSYNDINSEAAIKDFKTFNCDLIISIRFGQIFKNSIIEIPKLGVINLHSGILPKYRGVLASFWSILNKEQNIGTTLHYIDDPKIDAGPIIKISSQKIDYRRSLIFNIASLYHNSCQDIIDHLNKLNQSLPFTTINPQTLGPASYYSFPTPNDLTSFADSMALVSDEDVKEIFGWW